jgi:nitrate/nitrite transport system substrate-binding protein
MTHRKHDPLGDPFSSDTSLEHSADCRHGHHDHDHGGTDSPLASTESLIDRAVESAVVRAVFGGNDVARRRFLEVMGRSTFVAALSSVFPLAACKSAVKEELAEGAKEGSAAAAKVADGVEKKSLKVGFVPITCATPIIMAKPMGFYE